jgi:hypothetical protein
MTVIIVAIGLFGLIALLMLRAARDRNEQLATNRQPIHPATALLFRLATDHKLLSRQILQRLQ